MKYLLAFFLLFAWSFAGAKNKPVSTVHTKPLILKIDSSNVQIRKFDGVALHQYSLKKDFIYDQVLPEHETWWEKFWRKVWEFLRRIFGGRKLPSSGLNFSFMKYLFAGLFLSAVIFIVFKLSGLDLKMFLRKSKKIDVPYYESPENIHEINFEEEIQQAIDKENYRLAVRLLYLQTLKYLDDKEIIYWQPEKTNETYINEVQDSQKKALFAFLSRQFEYIWYGDFSIDADHFQVVRENFKQFNSKML